MERSSNLPKVRHQVVNLGFKPGQNGWLGAMLSI